MTTDFYRAFEDKHRGTRQLIKARLRVYLPFILPLTEILKGVPVIDLGCGRGEWLELLHENNILSHGVDLDQSMLAACHEIGLDVANIDAIAHLKSLAPKSVLAITGFHIAEHLPFPTLQTLLAEALRVLVPAGLLILETPNPENLVVGTASFYIDPTHQRPLPAQLLHFLIEHQGFGQIKHLRLQEDPRLLAEEQLGLYDVLAGASPDYAIVAQVSSQATQPEALSQAMEAEHGLSLYTLTNRYDQYLNAKFNAQLHTIHAAQSKAEEALTIARQTRDQLAAELAALHSSQSWRLTRPLRWLARHFRSGRETS